MSVSSKKTVRRKEKQRAARILKNQERAVRFAQHQSKLFGIYVVRDEMESLANLALCEAAAKYDPKKGAKFSTYLYFHVKAQLIDHLRASRKAPLLLAPDEGLGDDDDTQQIPDVQPTPEKAFALAELRGGLEKAVARLSDAERKIIALCAVEDRRVKDVAKDLGYSRVSVSRIKQRAYKKIQADFSKEEWSLAA